MSGIGLAVLVLLGLVLNLFVGAWVWPRLDDDDQTLWRWFDVCPTFWVQIVILEAWPVGVLAVLAGGREGGTWC